MIDIRALLRLADPLGGGSTHERRSALDKAHVEMQKRGESYASLGFDEATARRIEDQFSVSDPIPPKRSWFHREPRHHQASEYRDTSTGFDNAVPMQPQSGWNPQPDGWDGDVPIYLGEGWC